jgi:hypothetical protein
METKICNKCNKEQLIDEFKIYNKITGARINECRSCKIQYLKLYNEKTKKIRQIQKKQYREKNKEVLLDKKKKYYTDNKEKIKKYKKKWETDKRKNDTLFKLKQILRHRVYIFLKRKKLSKKNKTLDMVGCTPEFLKEYLENKFQPNMSWENYGDWHIDHIIPLNESQNENDLYKLCHYTNLQPLWAKDNLSKGCKILSELKTV